VAARIPAGDPADAKIGAPQALAQRDDDVAWLERTRRGAREQRRVQQVVDVADERDPDISGGSVRSSALAV
jgi:hypothetical protein